MAKFGWAYIDCADAGQAAGPTGSVQFKTGSNTTSGSATFVYHTAAVGELAGDTLVLTGTLIVSGTITASHYEIKDISIVDGTGSTYFGDSIDDTHMRSGSLVVSGTTAYVLSASATQGRTFVRGFAGRYRQITTAVAILQASDYMIGCSQSAGGNQTLYVPTASACGAGALLVIKDEYANRAATSIYVSASQHASAHQQIDNEDWYHLTGSMPAISLYSDGTNWFVF